MKKPFEWLDRGLIYGPYYTLCLTPTDYHAALKHLGEDELDAFRKTTHANATTHFLYDKDGKQCAVVTLSDWKTRSGIEIAGLLVHEAVHIFQGWCERVGEHTPGSETEAYSVQWISQQLMWEFVRQTKPARKALR